MLAVAEKLTDKSFFIRLNTITQVDDAVASDAIYHKLCWAKAIKKAKPKVELAYNYSKTLANIEFSILLKPTFLRAPILLWV